jgi:hypothetical protein
VESVRDPANSLPREAVTLCATYSSFRVEQRVMNGTAPSRPWVIAFFLGTVGVRSHEVL